MSFSFRHKTLSVSQRNLRFSLLVLFDHTLLSQWVGKILAKNFSRTLLRTLKHQGFSSSALVSPQTRFLAGSRWSAAARAHPQQ